MASITITVPDPVVNRVLDAIAATYHYAPATDGTKAQFARKVIARIVKEIVRNHELSTARQVVDATTSASVESDILIT